MRKNRGYKTAKKVGKFVRENCAPNPTESFGVFGMVGKIIGAAINVIISWIVHPVAYEATGTVYKKGKHPAWVGSVLYTLIFIGIMGLIGTGISTLLR